ncbi:MAG: hypothetical protein Q8P46_05010 [Hyphomicrobiales bacterium]|nr:hypothetical protein [Hyphomicrobiales bacterium]
MNRRKILKGAMGLGAASVGLAAAPALAVTAEKIPEPAFSLNEVGLAKYDELMRMLAARKKLTPLSSMHAELAARVYQKIHGLSLEGKDPSASDITQLHRALRATGVRG